MTKLIRRIALAAPLVLGGCLFGGGSLPMVGGSYTGEIAIQGQAVPGTLEVAQTAADLTATFEAPSFGLVADGEGSVRPDRSVTMELAYDLQCPGRAELVGTLSPDGRVLEGTIAASDCTGDVSGTFRFAR